MRFLTLILTRELGKECDAINYFRSRVRVRYTIINYKETDTIYKIFAVYVFFSFLTNNLMDYYYYLIQYCVGVVIDELDHDNIQ